MSAQTTYDQTPAVGFVGMLAEQFSARQVDSGLAFNGIVKPGYPVKPGFDGEPGKFERVDAGDAPYGIAIFSHHKEKEADGTFVYQEKEQFPILRKGRVYLEASKAIPIGADVNWVISSEKVTDAAPGGTSTLNFGKAITAAAADGDLIIVEVW